jgi:MFS family permease
VTTLWVTSQFANAVALPAYFASTLGLVFAAAADLAQVRLVLLYLLHVLMGAASGGIGLATGNIGLKLAPQGRGTAYLAAIGLVAALAGGAAPLLGGALAQWLAQSELALIVRWISPAHADEMVVLGFAHWEFLFALSALLGLYVMHALSRVSEDAEISERVVMQELALEALRTVNHLSSIGGMIWRRASVLAGLAVAARHAARPQRRAGLSTTVTGAVMAVRTMHALPNVPYGCDCD